MVESVERNIIEVSSETRSTAAASSIVGVIKRFIGGFVLTDEEKMQAGIDIDNFHEMHDARQVSRHPKTSEPFQVKGRIG